MITFSKALSSECICFRPRVAPECEYAPAKKKLLASPDMGEQEALADNYHFQPPFPASPGWD